MPANHRARYALLPLALMAVITFQAVAEPARCTPQRAVAAADGFGWDKSAQAPR